MEARGNSGFLAWMATWCEKCKQCGNGDWLTSCGPGVGGVGRAGDLWCSAGPCKQVWQIGSSHARHTRRDAWTMTKQGTDDTALYTA
eukprot:364869-Chlamydomonas_euryale.AAC.18